MPLLYEKKGEIVYITLDRPKAMNALNPPTLKEFRDALLDFREDEEKKVLIITGTGNKAFCAGADIDTTIPFLRDLKGEWWRHPAILMRGLELWKPVIAAVNGYALGGGLELALACDIRLASENAVFGVPEVTLGLIPGWGGTQRLPRAVPRAIASQMLLMGKPINAQEAYRVGLVNKVVPVADLMAEAERWAADFCKLPPLAVKGAKEALLRGMEMPLEDGLRLEGKINDYLLNTEDVKEGTQAFLEKRKPIFKGK